MKRGGKKKRCKKQLGRRFSLRFLGIPMFESKNSIKKGKEQIRQSIRGQ